MVAKAARAAAVEAQLASVSSVAAEVSARGL